MKTVVSRGIHNNPGSCRPVTHTVPLASPGARSPLPGVGVMAMFAYIVKVEQIVNQRGAVGRRLYGLLSDGTGASVIGQSRRDLVWFRHEVNSRLSPPGCGRVRVLIFVYFPVRLFSATHCRTKDVGTGLAS